MAGSHLKLHGIADSANHSPGTNNTITANAVAALVELAYGTSATANAIPQRDAGGHLVAPAAAVGSQVPNVTQVDSIVAAALQGLSPKEAVDVLNVIDDSLSAPPGSPASSDAYVLSAAGTGLWSAFSAGDLVVWDGAAWQLVVANSGGNPPDGTRVVVAGLGSGTAAGSFATHGDKIGTYASGTPTFETPANGWTVFVRGANEPLENTTYAYDSTPGAWVQISGGTTAHNSTTGLQGGTAGEYFHLTNAEQLRASANKAEIALAGTNPVPADFGTLAQTGDWAYAKGTTGKLWLVYRNVSNYFGVELTQITT